MSEASSLI